MKLSRRKLFQVALPAAVAVPLASELEAQTQPSVDADLDAARQYLRVSAQITRQVLLPMTTEPATRFIPRN
jgi:hypothetical protein